MKKVLQHFLGKITILVFMICAFAYRGNSQSITMSTANCTILADEVQMDIMVTNTSSGINLRWNGTVVRFTVPATMLPNPVTAGTYSFVYVGGSDFPASLPAPGSAASGASFNTTSRLLTWVSSSPAAYNNATCTAPLIAPAATMKIGRFSFKRTNGNFIADGSANFVWVTSSSCNLYNECTATTTAFNGANRTLATPCALTVPSSCAVTGSATTTPPSCFGGSNGTATVTLSGAGLGTSGTYTVDGGPAVPFNTNPFTVTGLSTANHTIVATYTVGSTCVSSPISANVGAGAVLTGSATGTPVTCFGGTDGTATVTLSSSTSGTYSVDGGPALTYNSNPFTVTGLAAGNHNIVATSAAGCVSGPIAVTIGSPAQLTGSATGTPVTCFGGTDGTATVTLSSSTSGTYSVDGGPALPYNSNPFTVSGLAAGSHNIVATSTAGCVSSSISVTIGSPAQLTGSAVGTDASCFGATDGSATVTLSSSTSGTYTVNGGPATAYNSNPFTISGLAAGSYNIVATSTAGCVSSSISVTIGSPAQLTGSATSTPTSCAGATDGTATVTLSSSTSGTYTVDGGSPVAYNSNPFTVSGLSGGNHTIVATSAAGCVSTLIGVNVGSPAALTGSGTTTPTTCGNPNSGTATITLSGSTSGTYTVDGGPATPYNSNPFTITGLTAGSHTIVATSSAGCVSSNIVVTVGSSAGFTATYVKTNITACNATNDGSITVTPNGGQAPFTYVWSGGYPGFNPGNVSSVSNLPIGYYNVTVTSSGGCGSVTFTNIHIEYAYYVYVTNSGTSSSACGNTGSIILYGNAGVTPYTYALSPGSNQPNPGPGAYQPGNTFSNLAAGSYTAFVKDAGGCVSAKNVTVSAAPAIVVNPFATGASSCAPDGSVQIFRTGGTPPYTYALSVGAGPAGTYQTSNFFGSLASGPYTAYVKDAAGCVGSATVTVAAGTGVSATTSKVNTSSCVNDGSIQVNATGGVAPYSYSLNGGAYQPGNGFANLGAGNYTVQVKDSKGCLSPVYNVTININTIVVTASATAATSCAANNGKIQLFRTGGYGPYTYSLDGNTYQSSTTFTNLAPGTYQGFVKDSKTCIGSVTGIVVGPSGCEPPPPPFAGTTTTSNVKQTGTAKLSLQVQAYPNPTESEFTLVLNGYNVKEKVSIVVTDLMGRKVYQVEGTGKSQYRFGSEFIGGMYNVQVIQGTEKASIKLVKE